jgi:hypothetical protein
VRTIGMVRARAKIGFQEAGLQHSPPRGMKVKSLCSLTEAADGTEP